MPDASTKISDISQEPAYEGWAILELMGHRKTAGRVSQVQVAGVQTLRVDTPGEGETFIATQFYSGAAIYCMTPCDEEVARNLLTTELYSLPPAVRLVLPKPEHRTLRERAEPGRIYDLGPDQNPDDL